MSSSNGMNSKSLIEPCRARVRLFRFNQNQNCRAGFPNGCGFNHRNFSWQEATCFRNVRRLETLRCIFGQHQQEGLSVKARFVFGIVFSLLCLSSVALAQNYRGSVRVRVSDQSGAVIKGAKLSIVSQDTNETRTSTKIGRASCRERV